jgi:hypothetical protein
LDSAATEISRNDGDGGEVASADAGRENFDEYAAEVRLVERHRNLMAAFITQFSGRPATVGFQRILDEIHVIFAEIYAAADAAAAEAWERKSGSPSEPLAGILLKTFQAAVSKGRSAWGRANHQALLKSEPGRVERFMQAGSPEEGPTMINQSSRKLRAALMADLISMGFATIPGTLLVVLIAVLRYHFVVNGWPLFAILWLGLFAGILSVIGARRHQ